MFRSLRYNETLFKKKTKKNGKIIVQFVGIDGQSTAWVIWWQRPSKEKNQQTKGINSSGQTSVVPDEGSKPEILSRIAQTTAALTRLKPLWNERSISISLE